MQAGDGAGLREASAKTTIELLEEAIVRRVSEPRYNLWFRSHTRFVHLGDHVVVGVPNLYFHDWLQKTFGDDVRDAVVEVFGPGVATRFAIDPELFQASRKQEQEHKQEAARFSPTGETHKPQPQSDHPSRKPKEVPHGTKRKWRNLAEFVVGASNRVAHASAWSVVDEPGMGANPLVIYGPTGTGKTHLLEGIYLGLKRKNPDARVMYVSAEDFMNRFLSALHQNKAQAFRKQFRECSTLLLDDLHFLAGKKATEIEFQHTFDALIADGCQIVVTCDCHPRLTEEFTPELADRLMGGTIWGVMPPDPETRLALLRKKAANQSPAIDDEVLKFLAERLRGNVRELEGAIHSLRHYSRVAGKAATIDLAREALGDLLRHSIKVVRVQDVEAAVCSVLHLAANALRSKSKAWSVSHARMVAIHLSRKHTSATHGEISLYFGNKTHSTAVAAEKRVRKWIDGNLAVKAGDREWKARDLVERIERELQK